MIFRGCPIERPAQAGAGEEGHRGSLGSDGGKLVAVSAIINHHNAAVPSPLPSLTLYTIRAGGDGCVLIVMKCRENEEDLLSKYANELHNEL